MNKNVLAFALAAALPVLGHAASAIDPCLGAHEQMGSSRKAVAEAQPAADLLIDTKVPTIEFEREWFRLQEPHIRQWFDANVAPSVRAVAGNVEIAFSLRFGAWKHEPAVRAEMSKQYRTVLKEFTRLTIDSEFASAQRKVNESCPMDFANQTLRVGIGAVALPVTVVKGNLEAARNENGFGAQVIRGLTGISVTDIVKHGLRGGSNSMVNCFFGGC